MPAHTMNTHVPSSGASAAHHLAVGIVHQTTLRDSVSFIFIEDSVWKRAPLERSDDMEQPNANPISGFWQPMDTLRETAYQEEQWNSGSSPRKLWSERRLCRPD